MRLYRGIHAGLFSGVGVMLATASAFAQDPAPVEPTAAPVEPAPAPAPEPVADPAATPVVVVEEPVAVPVVVEEEEKDGGLTLMAFGDAYASVQTGQQGSGAPYHRAYDSSNGLLQNTDGFSLAWAGLDIMYDSKYFAVTTSARFGQAVSQFYATPGFVPSDVGAITQAFVTWKPADKLSLDFGMFGTIYGAEVAESWRNLNYTRGALYYGYQPFWHTGVKANYALTDELTIKAMVVNDVNMNSLGQTPVGSPGSGVANGGNLQAGLQVAYAKDDISAALGTLQTLGDSSTRLGFDRFTDLVFVYAPGDLKIVFNGDMNYSDASDSYYYGLSLAAGYQFVPMFGAALRGEYIDPTAGGTGQVDDSLVTATLTFNFLPVPDSSNVVIRWDNRFENMPSGGAPFGLPFTNGAGVAVDNWFSSTVGVVVHTEGLL